MTYRLEILDRRVAAASFVGALPTTRGFEIGAA